MADDALKPASFFTQADALLRKNLTYQKRNVRANCCIVCVPVFLCLLIVILQIAISVAIANINKIKVKCDCNCDFSKDPLRCEALCGSPFSYDNACPLPIPPQWPPLLPIPPSYFSAVKSNAVPFTDLPNESCRSSGSCPVTILVTGNNQSLGESSFDVNSSNLSDSLANFVLGSVASEDFPIESLTGTYPLYYIRHNCSSNLNLSISIPQFDIEAEAACVRGINLWRKSSSEINDELYKGYLRGNEYGETNQILAAYDFLNSDGNTFNVSVWYNSTNFMLHVPRLVNLVVLAPLVYEKQQKLRIMMKMHGLSDGPYLMISYIYSLFISLMYVTVLVIFGSVTVLKFFRLNDYSLQFVFYFFYINLQIAMTFLVATFFSHVKTASVVAYICVFATGLLGEFIFKAFIEDSSFPRSLVIALDIYPGFSLYHGLYEFSNYALASTGMQWGDVKDKQNGLKEVLYIMVAEWLVLVFVVSSINKVLSPGNGTNPLVFLCNCRKKHPSSSLKPNLLRESSTFVDMDKPDVCLERKKVEQLLVEPNAAYKIVCNNLRKVYPGLDGNPAKMAVQGLSLALSEGECFGMLGPNGAGKTSFISMMIGLTKPTSGTAYVQGLDLRTQMDGIYNSMGVCPQHDLLWECLTGREHLLFYGRLKKLKGSALKQAVEISLKSVSLFNGGIADKQAGKYSGGMKRRLSVAILLIGDPKVVYMDEPSTGLDPASRSQLWNVVSQAKQDRTIILTTHSMEEAEALCDRVGIYVDGSLRCIGNPKELKARYGGSYILTITSLADNEQQVVNLVQQLSPNAERVYHISGTQKFEMPKNEVRIADVFLTIEIAKSRFPVSAWGVSDTSLEDVFIKVASGS